LNEENIWVNLNERRNDNQLEMLQTVKDLKEILQSLKDYNECILKVKEELNDVLLNKLHDHEYFKNTKFGSNEIVNEPYKRKARNINIHTLTLNLPMRIWITKEKKNEYSSEGSDRNQ